jgi:hypothetical protein
MADLVARLTIRRLGRPDERVAMRTLVTSRAIRSLVRAEERETGELMIEARDGFEAVFDVARDAVGTQLAAVRIEVAFAARRRDRHELTRGMAELTFHFEMPSFQRKLRRLMSSPIEGRRPPGLGDVAGGARVSDGASVGIRVAVYARSFLVRLGEKERRELDAFPRPIGFSRGLRALLRRVSSRFLRMAILTRELRMPARETESRRLMVEGRLIESVRRVTGPAGA